MTASRPTRVGDELIGVRLIGDENRCRRLLDDIRQVADVVDVSEPYPAKGGCQRRRFYAVVRLSEGSDGSTPPPATNES